MSTFNRDTGEPISPEPMHPGIFWEVYGKRGPAVAYHLHDEVKRLTGPLLTVRVYLWHQLLTRRYR